MDIQPQTQQPMSDDQELAKVLAGVSQSSDSGVPSLADEPIVTTPAPTIIESEAGAPDEVIVPVEEAVVATDGSSFNSTSAYTAPSGELEDIQKDAIVGLRPLVAKLAIAQE